MEENLKFSVIVPVYNARDFLGKTLSSIMTQMYQNFEIIVVDDASTDGTGWYADQLKTVYNDGRCYVKVIHRMHNGGPTASLIRGHFLARGDVVVIVDGDGDVIEHDTLSRYAKVYQDSSIWMCGAMLDIMTKGQRLPSPQLMFNYQCDRYNGVQQFQPRSWRRWLWDKVPRAALKNPETEEWWRACSDASYLWPMWELSGVDRVAYVCKPLYVHNHDNPLNMFKDEKMRIERDGFFDYIKSLRPYMRLESKDSEPETLPVVTSFSWQHEHGLTVELDIKE